MRARDAGVGHVLLLHTQRIRGVPRLYPKMHVGTYSHDAELAGHVLRTLCFALQRYLGFTTLKQTAGQEEPLSPQCCSVPTHSAVAHAEFSHGMASLWLPSAEPAPTPRNYNGSLASLKERFPGHICNFAESRSPNGWLDIFQSSLDL